MGFREAFVDLKDGVKRVLWWGRSDVNYSRNRILRAIMHEWGWEIIDFHPSVSIFGDIQASLKGLPQIDLVWVPCFRQRDFFAAKRYATKNRVPILFDPLISSYDKAVYEKGKIKEGSKKAEKLRAWEGRMFQSADIVLADTDEHARFFIDELGASSKGTHVVIVGAEDGLFSCQPYKELHQPLEVLFYGSFIPLQGVDVIIKAAALVPEVNWTLLGAGKLYDVSVAQAESLPNVRFESWVPYEKLAQRIAAADILLGVFGVTQKAGRVIPNKVYQSLACGRPVITLESTSYSKELRTMNHGGIEWVPAGNSSALADLVKSWASEPGKLPERGKNAREIYETFFSTGAIAGALTDALANLD